MTKRMITRRPISPMPVPAMARTAGANIFMVLSSERRANPDADVLPFPRSRDARTVYPPPTGVWAAPL